MTPELQSRLQGLIERSEELARLLAEPDALQDATRFAAQSREYSRLEPLVRQHLRWQQVRAAMQEARSMLSESDVELRALANEELRALEAQLPSLEEDLTLRLLPPDPDEGLPVYLEIRAGTGGDEAALFVGDLLRMYLRYAESRRWKVEETSSSASERGGYKEIVLRVEGDDAYGHLRFEAGTHRVQRVPETEAQGRIHTSACTVAVLPERHAEQIEIDPGDLHVDTFRASGAGGQHVNKTDSAIRITHRPSGLVVECQDDRSQHRNRARAMALLQARLQDQESARHAQQQSDSRRLQVGSGDRSQRIRTYNFPQGRITDHRINLTLYQLDDILQGAMEPLTEALQRADRLQRLATLSTHAH